MIEHVKLFFVLVSLITGTGVFIFVHYIQRSFLQLYLKPLKYHVFFFNICILLFFVTKYYSINITLDLVKNNQVFFTRVVDLLFVLTLIGMMLSMFGVYFGFRGKPISNRKYWIAISGIILIVGSYIFEFNVKPYHDIVKWLILFQDISFDVIFFLEITALILMLFYAYRLEDKNKTILINVFSFLYLSGFFISVILIFFPHTLQIYFSLFVFSYINLIPVLWIKFYFQKYTQNSVANLLDNEFLDFLFEKYKISNREKDIINLIFEGKSNKEMTDILYISIHTVKNHIYNIYQKLGVKNRYQLLCLFLRH